MFVYFMAVLVYSLLVRCDKVVLICKKRIARILNCIYYTSI